MKKIYLLDGDKEQKLYNKLKDIMKKEQNVEIVNINTKAIKDKFKTMPDICIINEENLSCNIKVIFQQIKEAQQNNNIPLIVLTTEEDEEHIVEILKMMWKYV